MLSVIASAVLLASPTPAVVGSFGGHYNQNGPTSRWERFDLVLTNTAQETQMVSLCASDAGMILQTKQRSTESAFAIKFDDETWSFGCDERQLAAGESTKVGMFFRPAFEPGPSRKISVKTNVGSFLVG